MKIDFGFSDYVYKLYDTFHLMDLTAEEQIFCLAGILTVIMYLLVIVVGVVIDNIERFFMEALVRTFGFKAIRISEVVTFMGVVIHELSHALFATLTGAVVTKIKFFTTKEDDCLGYVLYYTRGNIFTRSLQHAMCACAPTVVGMTLEAVLLFLFRFGILQSPMSRFMALYLMVSMLIHMSMSIQDLKNYLKGFIGVMVVFMPYMMILINLALKF